MRLTELFDPSLVELDGSSTSVREVFEVVAGMFGASGVVTDPAAFVTELEHRESSFATSVGNGIAIPHGKSNVVSRAAFAVVRLRAPIQWDPEDPEDMVRLIVSLAVPEAEAGTTHVRMLSRLAAALLDDTFREALMSATSSADVEHALTMTEGD